MHLPRYPSLLLPCAMSCALGCGQSATDQSADASKAVWPEATVAVEYRDPKAIFERARQRKRLEYFESVTPTAHNGAKVSSNQTALFMAPSVPRPGVGDELHIAPPQPVQVIPRQARPAPPRMYGNQLFSPPSFVADDTHKTVKETTPSHNAALRDVASANLTPQPAPQSFEPLRIAPATKNVIPPQVKAESGLRNLPTFAGVSTQNSISSQVPTVADVGPLTDSTAIEIARRNTWQASQYEEPYIEEETETKAQDAVAVNQESHTQRETAEVEEQEYAADARSPATEISAEELRAVRRRADALAKQATDLASRSSVFAAEQDFRTALQLVAEAFDHVYETNEHSAALATGLAAIREAKDFDASDAGLRLAADIVRLHRSGALTVEEASGMSVLQAQRVYYDFAHERLSFAGGNEPVASLCLHGLGKLQPLLRSTPIDRNMTHGAAAACYFQAAVAVDANNFLAANELAISYAQNGRYEDAKSVLASCAPISGRGEVWRNLAKVYHKLGEIPLAQQAFQQAAAVEQVGLQRVQMAGVVDMRQGIVWMPAQQFVGPPPSDLAALSAPPSTTADEQPSSAAQPNLAAQKRNNLFFWKRDEKLR